jgi:hypothetical protein
VQGSHGSEREEPVAGNRGNWTDSSAPRNGRSSDADLEVGVEVGEADGGGVLERAVRLSPALHRRRFPRRPLVYLLLRWFDSSPLAV